MVAEWSSLSNILKKFLKFPKSEPHNSYEMDSYKKTVCTTDFKYFYGKSHWIEENFVEAPIFVATHGHGEIRFYYQSCFITAI